MVDVFKALADPSRRHLLDRLNARNGQSLRELSEGLDMARQSVSKHLAILEAANLVTTIRHGREKLHYLNAAPINDIAERWIKRYDRERVRALSDLKRALEETPMEKTGIRLHDVHQDHTRTSVAGPDRTVVHPSLVADHLRNGLGGGITHDLGQQRHRHRRPGQIVLESDPYRRLAYTWHTFTPELNERVSLETRCSPSSPASVAHELHSTSNRLGRWSN